MVRGNGGNGVVEIFILNDLELPGHLISTITPAYLNPIQVPNNSFLNIVLPYYFYPSVNFAILTCKDIAGNIRILLPVSIPRKLKIRHCKYIFEGELV